MVSRQYFGTIDWVTQHVQLKHAQTRGTKVTSRSYYKKLCLWMKTESINISSQLFDQLYGEIHVHYTDFPVQPVKQLAKPCSRQTWTLL